MSAAIREVWFAVRMWPLWALGAALSPAALLWNACRNKHVELWNYRSCLRQRHGPECEFHPQHPGNRP